MFNLIWEQLFGVRPELTVAFGKKSTIISQGVHRTSFLWLCIHSTFERFHLPLRLFLIQQSRQVNQAIDDGEDSETRSAVDLQFARNVAAMCRYGVD